MPSYCLNNLLKSSFDILSCLATSSYNSLITFSASSSYTYPSSYIAYFFLLSYLFCLISSSYYNFDGLNEFFNSYADTYFDRLTFIDYFICLKNYDRETGFFLVPKVKLVDCSCWSIELDFLYTPPFLLSTPLLFSPISLLTNCVYDSFIPAFSLEVLILFLFTRFLTINIVLLIRSALLPLAIAGALISISIYSFSSISFCILVTNWYIDLFAFYLAILSNYAWSISASSPLCFFNAYTLFKNEPARDDVIDFGLN